MRKRLIWLAASVLLAAGCGKTPDTSPATPEDEAAAEQRIKEEAARELKARQNAKDAGPNPDDAD